VPLLRELSPVMLAPRQHDRNFNPQELGDFLEPRVRRARGLAITSSSASIS